MKYLVIVLVSLLSTSVAAQTSNQNGIAVVGKATVNAEPDQFTFSISINERGASASKTKAIVDHKSRLVTNMYLAMGVNKKAIESARLQLIPRYEKISQFSDVELHQNMRNHTITTNDNKNSQTKTVINSKNIPVDSSNPSTTIYFEVIRDIKVTFTDFSLYDQFLDNVVKIGVSRISPLQTAIIDNESLYQQALIKALENANEKAQTIAEKIAVKLGKVVSLKESSQYSHGAYMMSSRSYDGFNSQVASQGVSAQVDVIFAINEDK